MKLEIYPVHVEVFLDEPPENRVFIGRDVHISLDALDFGADINIEAAFCVVDCDLQLLYPRLFILGVSDFHRSVGLYLCLRLYSVRHSALVSLLLVSVLKS